LSCTSKSLNEIYERTEKAVLAAQVNLQKTKEWSDKLEGVCACALLATYPLWWEPLPLQSSLALASRVGQPYNQLSRVVLAALNGCKVLLNAGKAVLYLTEEAGARHNRLNCYSLALTAEDRFLVEEVARPTGHGAKAGLLGRCLKKGHKLSVADPPAEERYNPEVDGELDGAHSQAMLLLPLKWAASPALGVLQVSRTERPGGGEGKTAQSTLNRLPALSGGPELERWRRVHEGG
jgi:hypothetical protein